MKMVCVGKHRLTKKRYLLENASISWLKEFWEMFHFYFKRRDYEWYEGEKVAKWSCPKGKGHTVEMLGRDYCYDDEDHPNNYLVWVFCCDDCKIKWTFETETDRY